jgi:hypothetical protein
MTFDEKEIRLGVRKVVDILDKSNADFDDGINILLNAIARGMMGIVAPEDVDQFVERLSEGIKEAYEAIRKESMN